MGIDKERLALGWFSAAEGEQFANKVRAMSRILREKVTREEIAKTREILAAKA
jgi:coenzyme F420-reducing hydrogenase delta subunit